MNKKVLLGMSGGVDSAAAAVLLKRSGYDVTCVYMKMHDDDEFHRKNFSKASSVADHLGLRIYFHDVSDRFRSEVYDYFVNEYISGRTPNPCVVCNRSIKFGEMLDFADRLGMDYISTGHYVRTDGTDIMVAEDRSKDQSYFLAMIRKDILPRLIFPLGEISKDEARAISAEAGVSMEISAQKESQEICFVENSYVDILSRHTEVNREGEVVDASGNVVGTHRGYMHYTVGKRRGFTVRGAHEPHYVLSLEAGSNRIVVGKRDALEVKRFLLKDMNILRTLSGRKCSIKIRYRTDAVPARIDLHDDGTAEVELERPVYGLARGQYGVLYEGDTLLGGGVIV